MELTESEDKAGPAVAAAPTSKSDKESASAAVRARQESARAPRRLSPKALKRRLVLADAATIVGVFAVAFVLQDVFRPVPRHVRVEHLALAMIGGPVWLVALGTNKLYRARVIDRRGEEFRRLSVSTAVAVAVMVTIAFVLQYSNLSRGWVLAVLLVGVVALAIEREIARAVFTRLRRQRRISRRVVIIGTDANAIGLLHTLQRDSGLGYEVVGFVGDQDFGQRGGVMVLGALDHAEEVMTEVNASGALISPASVPPHTLNMLTRRLTDAGFHVALSSSLRDIDITRFRPQAVDGRTLMYIEPTIRSGWRAVAKRAFDLAVSSVALLIASPVLAVATIAIKLDSRGPVLFRQRRVGRDGEAFDILKLRTMVVDAEARKQDLLEQNELDGPLFKMANDPRITSVGRFLRRTSIDELPQLINVLKGEMSLVGPRPALPSEAAMWGDDLRNRLRVTPGMTGMWQVSGRNNSSFADYERLDLYYVDNWSILVDVAILARTIPVVLSSRGAY